MHSWPRQTFESLLTQPHSEDSKLTWRGGHIAESLHDNFLLRVPRTDSGLLHTGAGFSVCA